MSQPDYELDAPGPFTVDQLRSKDRYELSNGHAIYCAPTGGEGSLRQGLAFAVLDSDPKVVSAGVDAGFALDKKTMRAPDVAVGNVRDAPGWSPGAPGIAVEYAGSAQDERELRLKTSQYLAAGTEQVWVVRLEEQVVEVHRAGAAVERVGINGTLSAPHFLENDLPVRAFFDRETAHELTLRNLLQRLGYENLEAVRARGFEAGLDLGVERGREQGLEQGREQGLEQGREQGLEQGLAALREAVETLCRTFAIELNPEQHQQLAAASLAELRALHERVLRERRWQ